MYVGKEDDQQDNSAPAVCNRRVIDASLTGTWVRVLYTDNYYTSVKLAKHMFTKYGWTIVGTIVLTYKKSREDEDVPFWSFGMVLEMVSREDGIAWPCWNCGEGVEVPRAQQYYVMFFDAVDRSDRDSSDWSTAIRTNMYYISRGGTHKIEVSDVIIFMRSIQPSIHKTDTPNCFFQQNDHKTFYSEPKVQIME